jgi:uncharacterized protein (TIGR02147 family)
METWRPWNNYREALLHFYNEKRERNSSYSLRAFARDLSLSPSRLNGIINGKFGLSFEAAKTIAAYLNLSHGEKWLFQYMVESEHGRSEASRLAAKEIVNRNINTPSLNIRNPEEYQSILHWYTFALYEIIQNPRFKKDPQSIAEHLGIDLKIVNELIDQLIKKGALKKNGNKLECIEDFTFVTGINNTDVKKFHSELLLKVNLAIQSEKNENIGYNAWVISIDKKQLPMAKAMVQNFSKEFCRKFGRLGLPPTEDTFTDRDAIYCLGSYFFPLAQLEETPEESPDEMLKNP